MAHDGAKYALLETRKQDEYQTLLYPSSTSTNQLSLKQVSVILVAYLTLGTVCFFLVQDQIYGTKTNGILDAVYFCVVTMTAAGYGDLGPETNLVKSLASVFVFTGIALGGFALSKAADYIVGKQEILFIKAIHMRETYGPNEILKEAVLGLTTHGAGLRKCLDVFVLYASVGVGLHELSRIKGLVFYPCRRTTP